MPTLASNDSTGAFVGGLILGFLLALFFFAYISSRGSRARAKAPKLAGSAILELGEGLDLSKRYDIAYSGEWGSSFVERFGNVRIIGYVGSENDEAIAKMYMRGRWLVVEFTDGRRAYLQPRSIISLRQSEAL